MDTMQALELDMSPISVEELEAIDGGNPFWVGVLVGMAVCATLDIKISVDAFGYHGEVSC